MVTFWRLGFLCRRTRGKADSLKQKVATAQQILAVRYLGTLSVGACCHIHSFSAAGAKSQRLSVVEVIDAAEMLHGVIADDGAGHVTVSGM